MGYSSYSTENRSLRADKSAYFTAPVEDIFMQQKERKAHDTMSPKWTNAAGIKIRECRDSAAHPDATPILFYLDVTGSMQRIPHEMIKSGLPTLMSKLIQNGIPDAALMFGAIGDHVSDRFPLQVGQFESGDAELDMWLTRTYLEGNGGSNEGESYPLAWFFSRYVKTDAFEKRGKKSYLFTCGDEPFLKSYPASALKGLLGDDADVQGTLSAEQLFEEAQKENHIFHIFVNHGRRRCDQAWRDLLGQHLIETDDHTKIPQIISETILNHIDNAISSRKTGSPDDGKPHTPTTPYL